jgi:hypothetical protein
MIVRMVVGLVLTVVAFAVAGRRLWWLRPVPAGGGGRAGHPVRERAGGGGVSLVGTAKENG